MNFLNFINKIWYKPKLKFQGKNNLFYTDETANIRRLNITVYGNNNKIIIDKNTYIHNTYIDIGFPDTPANNCIIEIGKNTGINSLHIQMGENNSIVKIGNNCMLSYDIEINCTDHHSIFDNYNRLTNIGKSIEVQDNVWICKEVRIMKNSKIPSGCIVAQSSIVANTFDTENCVIAGNPAKIVKKDICWNSKRPNNFI